MVTRSRGAPLLLMIVVFATNACLMEDNHPIVDGVYAEAAGNEKITVAGSRIHFYIRISGDDQDRILDTAYGYTVLPDGAIQPKPVRSADAAFGVGAFDWYWDGTDILQESPSSDVPPRRFVRTR